VLPEFVTDALSSYPTLFFICLICSFPIPFPEDIVVITVGTLVAEGELEFWPAVIVCGTAMFLRDINAFLFARRFSQWILDKPKVRAFVGEKNIERWSRIFERNGALGIFLVRFAVGSRVKLLFLAASMGVRRRTMMVADFLGMCIVAPLLVWIGYRYGTPAIDAMTTALVTFGPLLSLAFLGLLVWFGWRLWRRRRVHPSGEQPVSPDQS